MFRSQTPMSTTLSIESETLQLTPGPSGMHPDVQKEVARQSLNHNNPDFREECRTVQRLARILFGTNNPHTGVLTASGTGGNEAGVQNFVGPGEKALYINSGFFSGRLGTMIERRGAKAIELDTGYGETIDPNRFEETLRRHGKGGIAAAYLAQVETSAGTQVPDGALVTLGKIARENDTMLCIDAVCAFGGTAVHADTAAYVSACSQKGVNAPPGTAPFTVAPFAMERLEERAARGILPGSVYFDLQGNLAYWRDGTYHQTPAIQGIFALRRAMEMTLERAGGDLSKLFREHATNQRALEAGLEAIGLINHVQLEKRAAVVSVFRTPEGMDARMLQRRLMELKQVRGRPVAGVEVALGKQDPAREIRMALLGLWSNRETVLDACDAVGQVTGENSRAIAAAERYFADHRSGTV